jgi:hypothetical protein
MEDSKKQKIQSIIDDSINLSESIKLWITKIKEVEDFFHNSLKQCYNILDKESIEYKLFDKWKIEKYGQTLRRSERQENKYTDNDTKINDLRNKLSEIIWYKVVENEKHFKAGETYETIRYFNKLFWNTKSEILIFDEYIDSNIFDFIEEIDCNIKIKILTWSNHKKIFKTLYLSYNKWNLEAKIHNTINHDRYIILDQNTVYHIWISFNGIGKSDFSVKKLDSTEKAKYIYWLWNNGKDLT